MKFLKSLFLNRPKAATNHLGCKSVASLNPVVPLTLRNSCSGTSTCFVVSSDCGWKLTPLSRICGLLFPECVCVSLSFFPIKRTEKFQIFCLYLVLGLVHFLFSFLYAFIHYFNPFIYCLLWPLLMLFIPTSSHPLQI